MYEKIIKHEEYEVVQYGHKDDLRIMVYKDEENRRTIVDPKHYTSEIKKIIKRME